MKLSYIILLLLSVNVYGQNVFTLNAKVPKNFDGQKIYLRVYDFYSKKRVEHRDSAVIRNNSFTFRGTITKPCELANVYMIANKRMTSNFNFILEKGLNELIVPEVKAGDRYPNNKLYESEIINSKANYIQKQLDAVWGKITEIKKTTISEGDAQRAVLSEQLKIIAKYPDEFSSLVQLYNIARSGPMQKNLNDALKVFNLLNPAIQSSALGKEFRSVISATIDAKNATKIDNKVQQFSVKTDKGAAFSNSSLKGKPYVIAFSATWCVPCQAYQGTLLALYNKYKTKGLKVVYFNLDDNEAKWKKEIREKKLTWINVSERTKFKDSKIANQFNALAIPLYLIVNRQSKIIYNADELKDDNYQHLEEYIIKAL